MHVCLEVEEIRSAICEALYDYDFENNTVLLDKRSLVALASTCRLFQDNSLNVLWRKQYSLEPLIRVLPHNIWRLQALYMGGVLVTLCRPVAKEELERIDYYRTKIRDLDLTKGIGIDEDALVQLSTYWPKYLLPGLQSLKLSLDEFAGPYLPHLPCLLDESVQRLKFSFISHWSRSSTIDLDNFQRFLNSVSRCSPNLTDLGILKSVKSVLGPSASKLPTHTFLQGFRNLKSLTLTWQDLSPAVLFEVGNIQDLRCLQVGTVSDWAASNGSGKIVALDSFTLDKLPLFCDPDTALRHLHLETGSLENTHIVLKNMKSSLTSISIDSARYTVQFDQVVEPLIRFINLTSLHLHYHNASIHPDDTESSKATELFSLRYLRNLSLNGFPSFILNNFWIKQAVLAWPFLEVLSLYSYMYKDRQLHVSLEGLLPISYHCKNLRELRISMQCYPFDVAMLSPKFGTTKLRYLQIYFGALEKPFEVLKCIKALFPELKAATGPNETEWRILNQAFKEAFH